MNMSANLIKKLCVTVSLLLSSSYSYATFLDAELHYGIPVFSYSGTLNSTVPSENKTYKGNISDLGGSFHIYPIPLIPVGVGLFGSLNNFDAMSGNVLKDGHELYSFSAKPSVYMLGLELAANAPLAIFIDPYVRAGAGILGGTSEVTLTTGTNIVTEALNMQGKSLTRKDYEAGGMFWQGLVGLKFKVGLPFVRIGVEGGYRQIMSMIIGDSESISTTTLDTSKVTSISNVPVVAMYENIGGMFTRIGVIIDL